MGKQFYLIAETAKNGLAIGGLEFGDIQLVYEITVDYTLASKRLINRNINNVRVYEFTNDYLTNNKKLEPISSKNLLQLFQDNGLNIDLFKSPYDD
jgi:uncharacterized protein YjfI (DUF2170 family)